MREELIAYALGDLGEEESRLVEQAVAANPELAEELLRIQDCLSKTEPAGTKPESLGEAHPVAPVSHPRGLATRTTQQVLACLESRAAEKSLVLAGDEELSSRFSLVDMTVILGVLLTLGCLFLPSIYHQRNEAQRLACQNNLYELGTRLTVFSNENRGFYPPIRPYEHAGMYSVRLVESQITSADDLSRFLVCSASPLAEELADQGKSLRIPTAAEFAQAPTTLLVKLRRTSGGSYGYQIGWVKNGYYLPVRNRSHCQIPVLADAPRSTSHREQGVNHGGQLINVLFQDGSVRSLHDCVVPCANDHLFLNTKGLPAASSRWHDAVVMPSGSTPGVDLPLPKAIQEIFRF